MKKQRTIETDTSSPFYLFPEAIVFTILDFLEENPLHVKSFSLTCKHFHSIEAKHRRNLKPLRIEHLPRTLRRYQSIANLDLSACPHVSDVSLSVIANSCNESLRSIDLSRSRFFSPNGLMTLAETCKNLVSLNISNAAEMKDASLAAVAEIKSLEYLWLSRSKLITDIGVGRIAVGCRKLKLISLKMCLGVSDLGVDLVAQKCTDIRILDLSYLPITNKCLSSILKLQHLEDLILEGCFGIENCKLMTLKPCYKSLKKLDISNRQSHSNDGLSSLISGAQSLQQLNLAYGLPVTAAFVDSMKLVSSLHSIKLDGCSVTNSGLKAIGDSCLSLREISLSKCLGVGDEGLFSLVSKHRDLKKLNITCCRSITDASIVNITNYCSSLTSLKMESCSLISREVFILIGQKCKLLEELDLTDNEIDEQGLKSIAGCSKLSTLKLGICLNLNDAGLAQIGDHCAKLIELDLYRSVGASDVGILAIARGCRNLEMINISYCKDITDKSIIELSNCLRLHTLESRGCSHITSLGLTAIALRCKQLKKLDIKKCHNINDEGMIALGHFCHSLCQIVLSYTSVTDVGLMSLARISCLQNITILHTKDLKPKGLTASLVACGGLRKAKLHFDFKALIPRPQLDHLQARGCVFEWRDKEFQAELDPKCWKMPLPEVS